MSDFDNQNNFNGSNNEKNNTEKAESSQFSQNTGDGEYRSGNYYSDREQPYRTSYNSSSIEYTPERKRDKSVHRKNLTPLYVLLSVVLIIGALFGGYVIGQQSAYVPSGQSNPINSNTFVTTAPSSELYPVVKVPETTIAIPKYDSPVAAAVEGNYVYVNEKAAKSVVSITTEATVYSAFYGSYVESGAGSGVIIANTGNTYYIITNNHVVDGYNTVKVFAMNGDKEGYEAELLERDWTNDIAVLRIETEDKLAVAEIGDSSTVKAGQNIAAIGNPLGLFSGTITPGIISAVTRDILIEGVAMTLIQHSAAVSPGNSGGGLFNMQGQLIGIVNAKSSGTSVESIGFAIPINTAYRVALEIINNGYASGIPSLDITFRPSGSYLYIQEYKHNDRLIASGQTTIEKDDILVAIDDKKISSINDIRTVLCSKEVGDKVKLTLYRLEANGFGYSYKTYTVEVDINEYNPTTVYPSNAG